MLQELRSVAVVASIASALLLLQLQLLILYIEKVMKGVLVVLFASVGDAFTSITQRQTLSSSTELYGLFDGVKDAFSAPALERSAIDSERETPIDRWMGWSVVSENQKEEVIQSKFL